MGSGGHIHKGNSFAGAQANAVGETIYMFSEADSVSASHGTKETHCPLSALAPTLAPIEGRREHKICIAAGETVTSECY